MNDNSSTTAAPEISYPSVVDVEQWPQDIPAHIISLARLIQRNCPGPGKYQITLNMPAYPNEAMMTEIARVETVRLQEIAV